MRAVFVLLVLSLVAATSAGLLVNKLGSRDAVLQNASISAQRAQKLVEVMRLPNLPPSQLEPLPKPSRLGRSPTSAGSKMCRRRCPCSPRRWRGGRCSECCSSAAIQAETPSRSLVRGNRVRRGLGSRLKKGVRRLGQHVRKAAQSVGRTLGKMGASISVTHTRTF